MENYNENILGGQQNGQKTKNNDAYFNNDSKLIFFERLSEHG